MTEYKEQQKQEMIRKMNAPSHKTMINKLKKSLIDEKDGYNSYQDEIQNQSNPEDVRKFYGKAASDEFRHIVELESLISKYKSKKH